jgi:hypothetical protein
MMGRYLLLTCIIWGSLLACKKEELIGDKYITLSYAQTYCNDPWGNKYEDSLTLKRLGFYLDSLDLYAAAVSIKQDSPPDMCAACFCKTGKVIYITTFDNAFMKSKYHQLGFN